MLSRTYSLALLLPTLTLLSVAPARAETTGVDTDADVDPYVEIQSPADGDTVASPVDVEVLAAGPDADPNTLITLTLDGELYSHTCDASPCTFLDVALEPGEHVLTATASGEDFFGAPYEVTHSITVNVEAAGETDPTGDTDTTGDPTGDPTGDTDTTGDPTGDPTGEPDPTNASASQGNSGDTEGESAGAGGDEADQGCGCTAGPTGSLAPFFGLVVLGALRRRRR